MPLIVSSWSSVDPDTADESRFAWDVVPSAAFIPDLLGDWDEPLAGRAAETVALATASLLASKASALATTSRCSPLPCFGLRRSARPSSKDCERPTSDWGWPPMSQTLATAWPEPSSATSGRWSGPRPWAPLVVRSDSTTLRHPSDAPRGHDGGSLRGRGSPRAELDRRSGGQPRQCRRRSIPRDTDGGPCCAQPAPAERRARGDPSWVAS